MNRLIQDAKYALRMMRRAPIFTAAIVLTIALAIAANTTIFSLVYAVLLKPLPYAEPDRIVQVFEKNDKFNIANIGASGINFFLWRDEMQGVQNVAGAGFGVYTLAGSGEPERFAGNLISPSLVRVLGIQPVGGGAFRDDEEKVGSAPVVFSTHFGNGMVRMCLAFRHDLRRIAASTGPRLALPCGPLPADHMIYHRARLKTADNRTTAFE